MFDTMEVSKKIKEARKKLNMTQVDLSDAMGVSYQAVSNWERGNSMPDISKISDLCKVLKIDLEDLVGDHGKEYEATKKMISNEKNDVRLDDVASIAPLVTPEDMEEAIHKSKEKKESISLKALIAIAPFVDGAYLESIIDLVVVEDLEELTGIAPFISEEMLGKLVERYEGPMDMGVAGLGPFLDSKTIQMIVRRAMVENNIELISCLAPFM